MVQPYRPGLLERLLGDLFRVVNRRVVWHRLGFLLSVVNLVALRTNLRRFNLFDTETREPEAPKPGTAMFGARERRTAHTTTSVSRAWAWPARGSVATFRSPIRSRRWEASSTPIRV